MRKHISFCLIPLICFGVVRGTPFIAVRADQPFASYGKLPWAEEKLHLDDFAMFLKRNPDMRGYVAFYVGENEKESNTKKRMNRVKRYLLNGWQEIGKGRITFVNAGKREETRTVLQHVLKTKPAPKF